MVSEPVEKVTTVKIKMIGGKCGCAFCKNGHAPTTRAGWKSLSNKHQRNYGKLKK